VSDDGLPNPPGEVTSQWSKASGPGTVNFDAPNLATTTASFSDAGTYVLKLTASDGELEASDDVVVTVNPAPYVYFVIPDRVYVETGETAIIPVTVNASNISVYSLVFGYITDSMEVFGDAMFN
jgi:hypothetical protein